MSEEKTLKELVEELRTSLAPTYEQSPEGRAYLAKIDATLRTHENGGQESGAGAVARVTDEGFIIETGLGIVPGSKLYLAPPSAQAIETAAIMKCVELCRQLDDDPRKDQDYASAGDCIDSLLALIPQDGLTQLRELQKDAERYRTLETLMFIGDVELRQDEDGGYSISLEPVENILAQRWTGNSPEEVVDAVTNLIGVPPLNSETSGEGKKCSE